MDQTSLLDNIVDSNHKYRPRSKDDKDKNKILLIVQILFMKVED